MIYLAICAIVRDENAYLGEWVRYHQRVGVERFFLFDHESVRPVAEELRPFIDRGIVSVMNVRGPKPQLHAYGHALKLLAGHCTWVSFTDADEFLVPVREDDLRVVLKDYEDAGGLAANWLMFGSSGHVARPPGLVMENFTKRAEKDAPVNAHVKSIVRPDRVAGPGWNAHHFVYKSPWHCVNERRMPVVEAFSPHTSDRIAINHYFSKSREEFSNKIARPRIDTAEPYPSGMFDEYERFCNAVEDRTIQRFLPLPAG